MPLTKLSHKLVPSLIVCASVALGGCTHALEIKNLAQYRPTSINPLAKRVSIGIVSAEEDLYMKQLVRSVGDELQRYSSEVVLPYNQGGSKTVDVIATIRVTPEYKGSGMNFLVNFPGFLVWAPAWHGYNYKVKYDFDVDLTEAKRNHKIDQFSVPVQLDVRHAQIDRTWTEISWLEIGVIAFIGGIYCINYDPDVTPLVAEKASKVLGENIAGEIVNRINNSGKFSRIERLTDNDERLASFFGALVERL